MNKKIGIFSAICLFFTLIMAFKSDSILIKENDGSKVGRLKLPEGFSADHLYSPSEAKNGSWVSMTFDDKGRMICSDQYGSLYRLVLPAIGSLETVKVEKLKTGPAADTLSLGYAHGLLYAFNSLYVMINNSKYNKKFARKSGLYRLQDTDNDDQFDKITILKEMEGDGEHGPHSIVMSPDKKSLHVICGNFTDPPTMDAYRTPNNWAHDNLFPHITDPRGHATDRLQPGGWVAKIDPEGKNWEMVSAGYRNPFDMAFNENGDLFVYDADMEYDFGMPWYRPTRICHATSGSEFGWRNGNGKWSPAWPDNLNSVINIGQGSPTNLLYLKNPKFPEKYQQTLLAFDWSFGIIHAIHLKSQGASYSATREEFLSGLPLPLTDGAIGPDGALYFLTGGRNIESDLFRVHYTGKPIFSNAIVPKANIENGIRKNLEQYHSSSAPAAAVDVAWPYLNHPDRFIRFAARIVLEHQPSQNWASRAIAEKDPVSKTIAMLALVRSRGIQNKEQIFNALDQINFAALSDDQKIDLLRVYEVAIARQGKPMNTNLKQKLEMGFPSKNPLLNRSLMKLSVVLEVPKTIEKTLALMKMTENISDESATVAQDLIFRNPAYGVDIANLLANMPPAQQSYYAIMLSEVKTGWNASTQEEYLKWYNKAFSFKGGRSYVGFLDKARKSALEKAPENKRVAYDKLSGGELVNGKGTDLANVVNPKGPWTTWTMEKAKPHMDSILAPSFENGRNMYAAASCGSCHAMKGEGGAIGPDLTQLGTRFSKMDMLEAIIEPDKTISDQYAATQFSLKNGQSMVGRLVSQDANQYVISQNPFAPEVLTKIPKRNVTAAKTSAVSIMYPGMINPLGKAELKDLIAYLMAGGNDKHKIYQK